MTNYISFELQYCIFMEMGDSKQKLLKSCLFSEKNCWYWPCKLLKWSHSLYSNSGGHCSSRFFPVQQRFCSRTYDWGACEESIAKDPSTALQLRYKTQICCAFVLIILQKPFHYPSCDQLTRKSPNLEQRLTICKGRNKAFSQRTCINCEKHFWAI